MTSDNPLPRIGIDAAVGGIPRPFRRLPETMILGPTGRRLWATYIERIPGFAGRIDYIHKTNIPALYTISTRRERVTIDWQYQRHTWYPSRQEVEYRAGDLVLIERKFITWDDVACDIVTVRNESAMSVTLELSLASEIAQDMEGDILVGEREIHHLETWFALGGKGFGKISIEPGAEANAVAAMGVGPTKSEVIRWTWDRLRSDDLLERHCSEYQSWFDRCPVFRSSDPHMDKMWAYRWYLLRRNLADPGLGGLKHPLYYEGRGLKVSDDPWNPRGWDFAKLIPFSTPFHMLEGRWYPDPSAAKGELLDLIENQGDNGIFRVVRVDGPGSYYADFIAWAAWGLYQVHPDKAWLRKVSGPLEKNVEAWLTDFDSDGNSLPQLADHNRTGKEYQPSWFWFGGFPDNPRKKDPPPLERVDVASYAYLNARALAEIGGELGNDRMVAKWESTAEKIKRAVFDRMWDAETAFFYDLGPAHEKALVKNVVGFDPFFAGIAGSEQIKAFEHLTNPSEFGTEWPAPSVSADCPVFAPDSKWRGRHIKGPHGAVWNGPTWPFTNSTVCMALGNASRETEHSLDGMFADLFQKYTRLMFRDGDIRQPNVVEHYNPLTGEWISREEDYFHSSWIDLVVTLVAGIQPSVGEKLTLDPLDSGLAYFDLDRLHYRGHRLRVTWWDGKTPTVLKLAKGFNVYVDGRLAGSRDDLGCLTVDPDERQSPVW